VETTGLRATFTGMEESTAEDWAIIGKSFVAHGRGLADRILDHLRLLDGDFGGFAVDRLTHSLQTATRAQRAGEDEEYVVCALLHDIGDTLGSYNHADIAAAFVTVREDVPGAPKLVAYVVVNSSVSSVELRRFLRERLPLFMVPDAVVEPDEAATTVTSCEAAPVPVSSPAGEGAHGGGEALGRERTAGAGAGGRAETDDGRGAGEGDGDGESRAAVRAGGRAHGPARMASSSPRAAAVPRITRPTLS